jgi:glycosyltransferase involved in cell wall biosynthesis
LPTDISSPLHTSDVMKIFIDVTSSCRSVQNTGMQRMTRKVFGELCLSTDVYPISWNTVGNFYTELGATEYRLLTDPFGVNPHPMGRPEFRGQDPATEFWRLLRRRRINMNDEIGSKDVFFVPDIFRDRRRKALPHFLERIRARKVAIFHDATDLRLTSVYGDRSRKSRPYVEALGLFDLVICVSNEARDDLHYFWQKYGCEPAKTCVEPWPGEFESFAGEADSFPYSQNTSSNLVVYVSSFHGRKNHLTLLCAAEKLWRQGLKFELKLIGRNVGAPFNSIVREIWKLRMRGRPLRWLRHVDDQTLLRAYRDCRFTVYPSLMEGFGLPIAESLAHEKPCVCGGNGALGEIAQGGGCLIVDQTSEDALAAGIKKLLTDQETYVRLTREARTRTFRSWSGYTEKLLEHLCITTSRASATAV